jgi:hypothetical protein
MTGRSVQGLPKTIDIAALPLGTPSPKTSRRRRRTLAAFLTGAGLLALCFCSLQAGIAAGLVNSANSPISFIVSQAQKHAWAADDGVRATAKIVTSAQDPAPRHKKNRAVAAASIVIASSSLPHRAVCVRLCDGYFFPVDSLTRESDLHNQEAACSSLCPDAPTQLFVRPAGSDKIEDAVSRTGAPYSSLPVAFANRTSTDKTCSCHRHPGETLALANDSTLRSGDSIMTPTGIVVFRGSGRMPYAKTDFTTLAKASMPKDKRAVLAAIERATLPTIMRQTVTASAAPRKSQISFAASSVERSKVASSNNSIRFVATR